MTKIALSPNASGTGTFTIAAPNSNSNRTLVLPDAAGELFTNAGGTLTGSLAVDGNLTVDTNTLFVDAASNNVGIGTSTPATRLDVSEVSRYTFNLSNAFTLQTSLNAAGSAFADDVKNAAQHIWQTSGTERMRITSNGRVAIGVADPGTARLNVVSVDNTAGTFAHYGTNTIGTIMFAVRGDGAFNTGQAPLSPTNLTTAGAANLFVGVDGFLYRSTSSLKYKTEVQDATHGLAEVMALRSVTYKSNRPNASGQISEAIYGGLIAEEVHDAGLTEFVQYAEDGTPDALSYGSMVALCIKAIQDQQAIIEALEARVAALKGASA